MLHRKLASQYSLSRGLIRRIKHHLGRPRDEVDRND
jgi:hypothetical protein